MLYGVEIMPLLNEAVQKIKILFNKTKAKKDQNSNHIFCDSYIGSEVKLGTNNTILPGTIITGNVIIGDENIIGPYSIIGTPAQHKQFYN